jgi:glucan biosynthesis protein C
LDSIFAEKVMRRYDLDWLRVLVFALLIFYHVGMFFVPWGWHLKNNVIYEWPRWPMLFLNQWRLPLLFVISGMGTYFALGKRTGGQYAGERARRLLVPLLFGMLVVVPPQVYMERLAQGQFAGSYFAFWPAEAFVGVYPEGNLSWHHLWFLPYLLIYSLLLLPAFLYIRRHPDHRWLRRMRETIARPAGLYWFLIPLYLIEALVEPFFPVTHALVDDWFTFANYLNLFFFGYLLIALGDAFWSVARRYRRQFLFLGLIGFTLLIGIRLLFEDSVAVHFIEAGFKVFNLWSWILAIFGYAAAYLNRPSAALSYANQAVYPFYILHQTVTILIAYFIMDLPWGFAPKFAVLLGGTFGVSWLIHEFAIRRWSWVRPFFGVKIVKTPRPTILRFDTQNL